MHFNPWFSMKPKLFEWQLQNGEAFIFGRSDWEYVLNTFCFGYKVGYKFEQTEKGTCNGNFLGIGADACCTALEVQQSAPFGSADQQRRIRGVQGSRSDHDRRQGDQQG